MSNTYKFFVSLVENLNDSRRRVLEKPSFYSYLIATLLSVGVVLMTIIMSIILSPYYLLMAPQESFDRLARRTDTGEFIDSFSLHMFYRRVSASSIVGLGAVVIAATSFINVGDLKFTEPQVAVKEEAQISENEDLMTVAFEIKDDHNTTGQVQLLATRDCEKGENNWTKIFVTSVSADNGAPLIDNEADYQVSDVDISKDTNNLSVEWDVAKFLQESEAFGGGCLYVQANVQNEEEENGSIELAVHEITNDEDQTFKDVLALDQEKEEAAVVVAQIPVVVKVNYVKEFPVDEVSKTLNTKSITHSVYTGAGKSGGPHVKGFLGNGDTLTSNFMAYGTEMTGGVNIALGDTNGNGQKEIITGSGQYNHVRVFDQRGGAYALNYFPFAENYSGGVRVATGDIDGDGIDEIAMSTATENYVKIYKTDVAKTVVAEWAPYASNYNEGVDVAMGDVDGDGLAEVITSSLKYGHVRVFEASGGVTGIAYYPFGNTYQNGVEVAAGDVDGDGVDEIVAAEADGGNRVKTYEFNSAKTVRNDFASLAGHEGGVTIDVADIDGDGRAEIAVGAKNGGAPIVRVFANNGAQLVRQFYAYDMSFNGGVNVALY
ncbi:MAG: VCBS repeat-containing protein [bacterium]